MAISEYVQFLITKLGHSVLLGATWLQQFDVSMKRGANTILFKPSYCKHNYLTETVPIATPGMVIAPDRLQHMKSRTN